MTLEEIERIEARLKIFREAAETGREVQLFTNYTAHQNNWVSVSGYDTNSLITGSVKLRLKPEPRRFWAAKATRSAKLFSSEDEATAFAQTWNNHEIIELVEVLK